MTRIPNVSRAGNGLTIADAIAALRSRLFETIHEWRRRARSRHDLMKLSDRDLWDLRLTRVDAQQEASKPFWEE